MPYLSLGWLFGGNCGDIRGRLSCIGVAEGCAFELVRVSTGLVAV